MYEIQLGNEPSISLTTFYTSYEFSSNIKPETEYKIQLTSTDFNGAKVIAQCDTKTTAGLPNAPSGLKATANGNSIETSWTASDYNGKVLKYTVIIRGATTGTKEYNTEETTYSSGDLISDIYYISVKAETAAGYGPEANYGPVNVPQIKMEGKLDVKQLNPFTVNLKWSIKEEVCDFYSNTIYYSADGITKQEVLIPATDTYTLEGLMAGKEYSFTVVGDCMAGPGAGTVTVKLTTPSQPPSAPQNLTITEVTGTGFMVQWEPPVTINGVLELYRVRLISSTIEEFTLKDKTSRKFDGLTSNTLYTIEVAAKTVNNDKFGPSASEKVTTAPSEADIPEKPQYFKIELNQVGLFELSWKYTSTSPAITSFNLKYYTGSLDPSFETVPHTQKYIQLKNLKRGAFYTFELKAMSHQLESEAAIVSGTTVAGDPDLPEDIMVQQVTLTSLLVTWKVPVVVAIESQTKSLLSREAANPVKSMLMLKAYLDKKVVAQSNYSLSQGSGQLTNFPANMELVITAQAHNTGDFGGYSDEIVVSVVRTWPGAPGKPTIVKMSSLTSRSLQITLVPPADATTIPIEEYKVELINNETRQSIQTLTRKDPIITFTDLTPWTIYLVEASATSSGDYNGNGAATGSSISKEAQTLPHGNMAPGQGSVMAVDNNTIKVEWKVPYGYQGEVLGYNVRVDDIIADQMVRYIFYPLSETTATIKDLNPGTDYCARVASKIKQTINEEGEPVSMYMYMGEAKTLGEKPEEDGGSGGGGSGGDGSGDDGLTGDEGGLSGGAIAGIVIGILVLIILIVLILLLLRRRGRSKNSDDEIFYWSEIGDGNEILDPVTKQNEVAIKSSSKRPADVIEML